MKHTPSKHASPRIPSAEVDWHLPPPAEELLWRGERGIYVVVLIVAASVLAMASVVFALLLSPPMHAVIGAALFAAALAVFWFAWRSSRTELTLSDIRACRSRGAKLREMPLGELTSVVVTRGRWQTPLRLADVTIRVRGDALRFSSVGNWDDALRSLQFVEEQRGRMLQVLQKSEAMEMYVSAPGDARLRRLGTPKPPPSGNGRRFSGPLAIVIPPLAVVFAGTLMLLFGALWPRVEASQPERPAAVDEARPAVEGAGARIPAEERQASDRVISPELPDALPQ